VPNSDLIFKVRSDTGNAVAGFKALGKQLGLVKKDSEQTSKSLDKIGKTKVAPKVDSKGVTKLDEAIKKSEHDLAELHKELAKRVVTGADTKDVTSKIRKVSADLKVLKRERTKILVDANTQQAQSKLFKIKAALRALAGKKTEVKVDTDEATSGVDQLAEKMAKVFGGLGKVASGLGPLVSAIGVAAVGAVAGVAALGVKTLQLADNMDNAKIAFTQFLGSSEKADNFLSKLQDLAAHTPFEFAELQQASKMMLAFGFRAKDVVPLLTTLGDAAALTGSQVEDLANVFGQMRAKGKLGTEDITQLVEKGIPVWDLLSKATGKNVGQLQKMATDGKLLSSKYLPMLQKEMDKTFGGGMAKQAETLGGMISTLKDTFTALGVEIGNALLPFAKTIMPQVQSAVEGLSGKIIGNLPAVIDGIAGALTGMLKLPGMLLRGLAEITAGFTAMTSGAQRSVAQLVDGIATALDSLSPLLALFGTSIDTSGLRKSAEDLRKAAGQTDAAGQAGFDKLRTAADAADAAVKPIADSIEEARKAAQRGVTVAMDTRAANKKISDAEAKLKRLKEQRGNVTLDADKKHFDSKIKEAERQLAAAKREKANIPIDANISKFKSKLGNAETKLRELKSKHATPEVRADITKFENKRKQAVHNLAVLTTKRANPKLDANSKAFKDKVRAAESKLNATSKKKATPKIVVSSNAATVADQTYRRLHGIPDEDVYVNVYTKNHSMGGYSPNNPQAAGASSQSVGAQMIKAATAAPAVTVNVHVRDKALADLIDVRVAHASAVTTRVLSRRRAVLA